ncbi:MAG: PEP-CTERM sorting domain-containing protein [Phycisphaerae bacterium]|jgi:hypothetical protein|nr:PEP-CTERM sorting domain-containing protein [Phycisphaerae bacterium]
MKARKSERRLGRIGLGTLALMVLVLVTGPLSASTITTVPPGLGQGDLYRLVFVTDGADKADNTSIAYYNAFVTAQANLSAELAALGTTWKVIGSTTSVNARTNTGTSSGTGVPIYRLDGTVVADNYFDLWDGSIDADINVNQYGISLADSTVRVHTGTQTNGAMKSGRPLGSNLLGTATYGGFSPSALRDRDWVQWNSSWPPTQYPFYAMSDVIEAPEPATMSMLALGGLAILKRRRRKA